MTITALDIVTDALRELRLVGAADVASGEDAAFGLGKLNRLLDRWNNQRCAVYCDDVEIYTTPGSVQPVTIGPSGDFEVTPRPQTIEAINYVSGGLRMPVTPRSRDWWESLLAPTITGTIPTDFYYLPDWPDGAIYLYPVCGAVDLELFTRKVLSTLDLTSTFTLPPGYQDAITLTLAEDLSAPFGVDVSPLLARNAQAGRARIFAANRITPTLSTCDAGLGGGPGYFDYRSGQSR
jgi:hypothetical protein